MKFKHKVLRLAGYMLLGFAALFLARLGYGYLVVPPGDQTRPAYSADSGFHGEVAAPKKNYASDVYRYKGVDNAAGVDLNQKYEKTASIQSSSTKFDEDEKKVRTVIADHNAIIQFENGRGNEGQRVLRLVIGVQPALFDVFSQEIQKIGTVRGITVTKTDKTNEFLALKAQKLSLENTRNALIELKKSNGQIAEFIKLQNRILEIEQQLQKLGVQLGEFDEVNAFCTVNLSLAEQRMITTSGPGFLSRVEAAFKWSATVYVGCIAALLLIMLCAFVLLAVDDRFALTRRLLSKLQQ